MHTGNENESALLGALCEESMHMLYEIEVEFTDGTSTLAWIDNEDGLSDFLVCVAELTGYDGCNVVGWEYTGKTK